MGGKNETRNLPLPRAFERAHEAECWGGGGVMGGVDAQRETLQGLLMRLLHALYQLSRIPREKSVKGLIASMCLTRNLDLCLEFECERAPV